MPIVDIQARFRELGRIRLGVQEDTGRTYDRGKMKGKPIMRPKKLPRFRLTSPWQHLVEQAADVFGGTPGPCEIDGTDQYEVIVDVEALPVVIPPGEVFDQWYELWKGGGCERRCDGVRQVLTDQACRCPKDPMERQEAAAKGNACKPTTRLRLMLPDVADVGIWRLESHGFHAAAELGGAAGLVEAATRAGAMIPADLRLQEREGARRPGQPRKKFYVPAISFRGTLGPVLDALGILETGADMPAILGAVQPRPTLEEGGRAELPPAKRNTFDPAPTEAATFPGPPPDPAPSGPVDEPDPGSVVDEEPAGFEPPTEEQKAPAKPAEVPEPEAFEPPKHDREEERAAQQGPGYTGPQIIAIKLSERDIKDRAHRLHVVSSIVGRPLGSSKDLKPEEIRHVIEVLNDERYAPPDLEGEEEQPGEAPTPPAPDPGPSSPSEVVTGELVDQAEAPRRRRRAAPPPDEWDGDRWRAFLRDRGVKVTELMREAQKIARENDATVGTLDDIAGLGIGSVLVGFVEDLALERGGDQ